MSDSSSHTHYKDRLESRRINGKLYSYIKYHIGVIISQTGATMTEAIIALDNNNGDIIRTIIDLLEERYKHCFKIDLTYLESDASLILSQTGCTTADAIIALCANGGDIVNAIIDIADNNTIDNIQSSSDSKAHDIPVFTMGDISNGVVTLNGWSDGTISGIERRHEEHAKDVKEKNMSSSPSLIIPNNDTTKDDMSALQALHDTVTQKVKQHYTSTE